MNSLAAAFQSKPRSKDGKLLKSMTPKLHPRRFPGMSAKMAAYVGYMVGQTYTTPEVVEMQASDTGEDILYLRRAGHAGFNHMESWSEFQRNWNRLLEVTYDLTPDERKMGERLLKAIPIGCGKYEPESVDSIVQTVQP
jgi:hypothetical protein